MVFVPRVLSPDKFIAELRGYAEEVPTGEHPWFQGILRHRWSRRQIILGELQHYLRVRTNPIFFGYIAINAVADKQHGLMDVVLENFMEELAGKRTHVDIMLQFLEEGGISRDEADRAEPAPGTMAAMEMIVGCCQRRSALEGLSLLSFVESQLGGADGVSGKVYRELTGYYGFSKRAAETYRLHAEQDAGHGQRQVDAIRRYARDPETQEKVRRAVKLGLTAFSLEWDGHVQAMTDRREFWDGKGPLRLRQPRVRLPRKGRPGR
jgi:pyrroloquinoline quinone (PQQ) biosynthesis protein C